MWSFKAVDSLFTSPFDCSAQPVRGILSDEAARQQLELDSIRTHNTTLQPILSYIHSTQLCFVYLVYWDEWPTW